MSTTKTTTAEEMIRDLIERLGEDPNRLGLKKTPQRAWKALQTLTQGYQQNLSEVINDALFPTKNSQMVIVKDIELYSLCEHHLLPFMGVCHVGYCPNGKVLGLSKIARIVDLFARRLQIQENLTDQIAECIGLVTEAKGVGVVIEAEHLCMRMRGVGKQHSRMVTSSMFGLFRDDVKTRGEFLQFIKS